MRRRWLSLFPSTQPPDLPSWPAPEHVREALRATYHVLDQMPADERIAFTLRRFDGMDLLDIATACNVSLATVKRRLTQADQEFRALARLRPESREWLEMEDADDP